jgi:hypothetical protein
VADEMDTQNKKDYWEDHGGNNGVRETVVKGGMLIEDPLNSQHFLIDGEGCDYKYNGKTGMLIITEITEGNVRIFEGMAKMDSSLIYENPPVGEPIDIRELLKGY